MGVVEPFLRRKQLVRVLVKHTVPPLEINALYPPGGSVLPKTRLFLEMLAEALA